MTNRKRDLNLLTMAGRILIGLCFCAAMPAIVQAQGSPDIDLWEGHTQYFGENGSPQPYVNILGSVSDPDGIASLVYSLNGGSD